MAKPADKVTIKKYANRRLYDTESSSYITLDRLAAMIREGRDFEVVDAKTGADLTQVTLTQIIMEGRGGQNLLPSPLLHQLIRLGDDALADFFGRYVQAALELYLQARKTTQSFMPFNPLVALTQYAANASPFSWGQPSAPPPPPPVQTNSVDDLRRELDELKGMLRKRKK